MTGLRIAVVGHIRHPIAPPFQGGMESYTWQLVRGLAAKGHQVHLLASGDSRDGLPDGVTLHPIIARHYDADYPWHNFHGTDQLNDLLDAAYARAARLLVGGGFDVVHNNALHRFIPRLARAAQLPMVTSLHIPPFTVLRKAVEDGICDWHRQTVTSRKQLDIWWPDGAPQTARVVHNGIDPAQWPFGARGNGRAIWSGRITPTKGVHLAIDAAQLAGLPLDIYGGVEHRDYFETQVRPRLNDNIRYHGHVQGPALSRALQAAQVFLFTPLWEEPFGLVAAEAMASGLPVAATPHGATAEVVGPAGAIATSDSAASLADAIRRALTVDRGVVRAWCVDHNADTVMLTRLERLYRRTMACRPRYKTPVAFPTRALRIAPKPAVSPSVTAPATAG